MEIKSILITGNKGLIGSKLMQTFQDLDVQGVDLWDDLPAQKFDLIIHCASKCVIREVIKDPTQAARNIDITFEVLEKARKDGSAILLFSSSRVMHSELNPYIVSKNYLEQMAEAYKNCYGLKYIVIRPETVWGMNEPNKRVISTWIRNLLMGDEIIVYGDENKELSPIHVNEFAGLTKKIVDDFDRNLYRTISISGQIKTVKALLWDMQEHFQKFGKIKYLDPEMTQPQRCMDAKIRGVQSFKDQLKEEFP